MGKQRRPYKKGFPSIPVDPGKTVILTLQIEERKVSFQKHMQGWEVQAFINMLMSGMFTPVEASDGENTVKVETI